MTNDQRTEVHVGDVIELNLRFLVHSIEHVGPGLHGPAFTGLTYVVGEPRAGGHLNEFTFEVPDGFGRIVILEAGASAA